MTKILLDAEVELQFSFGFDLLIDLTVDNCQYNIYCT